MAYEKINSKKYTIRLSDELVDVDVPYGKARALFEAFVKAGGNFNAAGEASSDMMSFMDQFGTVGDILLSKYGAKGKVVAEGDCHELSTQETIELFKMAAEIVSDFTEAILEANSPQKEMAEETQKVKGKKA